MTPQCLSQRRVTVFPAHFLMAQLKKAAVIPPTVVPKEGKQLRIEGVRGRGVALDFPCSQTSLKVRPPRGRCSLGVQHLDGPEE